jgi:DNA-binding beta-propeller fold protein YncE
MITTRATALLGLVALASACRHDLTRPVRDRSAGAEAAAPAEGGPGDRLHGERQDLSCAPPCVTTFAGRCGTTGAEDGALDEARFGAPSALLVRTDGSPPELLVADSANGTVRLVAGGRVTTTVSGLGQPAGLALNGAGHLFVSDESLCRLFDVVQDQVTPIVGPGCGYHDGAVDQAAFEFPEGLLFVESLGLMVADSSNSRIRLVAGGTVSTWAGNGLHSTAPGPLLSAGFAYPVGLTTDAKGTIFVAQSHGIRRIEGNTVGPAIGSSFLDDPRGMAVDAGGALLIADAHDHAIRRLVGDQITTFAGSSGGYRDGPASLAEFRGPRGIAIAADGIYVADTGNHCIRKISR